MHYLQIALAFAVTMLVFSTLASMLVEILFRILQVRQDGLQLMLKRFVEKEPAFEHYKDQWENLKKQFSKASIGGHTLDTEDLVRQFANTDAGKQIFEKLSAKEKEIETVIEDFAARYEEYERRATEEFRSKSYIFNCFASLIVAFALNVNVVSLFKGFHGNAALTEAMAGKAENAMTAYEIQAKQLEKAVNDSETGDKKSAEEQLDDLKKSVEKFQGSVEEINKLGLPVGYGDGLGAVWNELKEPDADSGTSGWGCCWVKFLWFVSTLITGLLIGLGGPFWFDTVKRLNVFSGMFRGLRGKGEASDTPASATPGKPAQPKEPSAKTLTEHFLTAVKALKLLDDIAKASEGNSSSGRALGDGSTGVGSSGAPAPGGGPSAGGSSTSAVPGGGAHPDGASDTKDSQ